MHSVTIVSDLAKHLFEVAVSSAQGKITERRLLGLGSQVTLLHVRY